MAGLICRRAASAHVDAYQALARDLDHEPVTHAYVFGSFAKGAAGPLSDVDVAILPREGVPAEERMALASRVSLAASEAFGVDRADVVLLDEAPPALAFEAIQGRILVDRSTLEREMLEARIMSAYHDRAPREARWNEETLRRYRRGEFA